MALIRLSELLQSRLEFYKKSSNTLTKDDNVWGSIESYILHSIYQVFWICFDENSSPSVVSLQGQRVRTQLAVQRSTLNEKAFVRMSLKK
jgi:hypothetical protein